MESCALIAWVKMGFVFLGCLVQILETGMGFQYKLVNSHY